MYCICARARARVCLCVHAVWNVSIYVLPVIGTAFLSVLTLEIFRQYILSYSSPSVVVNTVMCAFL